MQECLFCRIVAGEIPSFKVYEDEAILAALDIRPANAGHVVIFSKKHYPSLLDIPAEELSKIFLVAKQICVKISQAIKPGGINLLVSVGEAAGQKVPHFCMHLVPRNVRDKVTIGWEPVSLKEEDFERIKQMLKIEKIEEKPKEEEIPRIEEKERRIARYWRR
jgi:histidine triad (HIT) family protein